MYVCMYVFLFPETCASETFRLEVVGGWRLSVGRRSPGTDRRTQGGEERGFFQKVVFFQRSSFFWKVVFQVFSRPPKGRLLEGSQNGGFRGFQIQRSSFSGPSRTGVERVQGRAFTGCSVQSVHCVQRAALPVCAVRSVYSGQRVRRVLCPR